MQKVDWRRIGTVALVDLGAPVALTIATVHELDYDGSPWTKWVCALALVWTLVLRRRFPVSVFVASSVLGGLLSTWSPTVAELALLVALYSVAAHRRFPVTVVCGVALEVAVVLAAFRYAPTESIDDYVIVLSGIAAAALFLGTTLRSNRRYLAAVEDRADRLERERAQQAELAAADERARIAREMHDIVAHGLAVVVTLSEGAAATAVRDPERAEAAMRQVADAGRSSLEETRRLLHVLRSGNTTGRAPEPDLTKLDALVADVRAAGLAVTLASDVEPGSFEPTAEAALFRVVQESLTNVLKHAGGATRVHIALAREHAAVRFSITDDGRARAVPGARDGSGIVGMRERIAIFGGMIDASRTDAGWAVRGVLPVAAVTPSGVPA